MAQRIQPSIKYYIKEKIRMIEEEFRIELTEDEKEHFYWLETERDVDQYAHDIFVRKL